MARTLPRRSFLLGIGAGAAAVAAGGVALSGRGLLSDLFSRDGGESPGPVPDAPVGDERVEADGPRPAAATSTSTPLFPPNTATDAGCPFASSCTARPPRPPDFAGFGLGRFLTAAVRAGAPRRSCSPARPATGCAREPAGVRRPAAHAGGELPAWCTERGFDTGRVALWGWSMGGYGVLRLAEVNPRIRPGLAAFSPACSRGDAVFRDAGRLDGTPLGLSCGLQDGLLDTVKALAACAARAEDRRSVRRRPSHPPLLEPLHARRLRLPGRRAQPLGLTRRHPTFAFAVSYLAPTGRPHVDPKRSRPVGQRSGTRPRTE